jgi:hypothetical protein
MNDGIGAFVPVRQRTDGTERFGRFVAGDQSVDDQSVDDCATLFSSPRCSGGGGWSTTVESIIIWESISRRHTSSSQFSFASQSTAINLDRPKKVDAGRCYFLFE